MLSLNHLYHHKLPHKFHHLSLCVIRGSTSYALFMRYQNDIATTSAPCIKIVIVIVSPMVASSLELSPL